MKFPIKSIFAEISEAVFTMNDLSQAKKFVMDFVSKKDINDKDKKVILYEVDNAKNIVRFQTYIANSLLKYEGMGMNQINKTAREAAADTATGTID